MELVCIVCPRGCHLHAEKNETAITVTGNRCPRGEAFTVSELTDPRRSLTTTVRTAFASMPMLPVRTDGEIPKALVRKAVRALAGITVTKPLVCGDVVCENLLDTGVRVIATASCKDESEEAI